LVDVFVMRSLLRAPLCILSRRGGGSHSNSFLLLRRACFVECV
jgi:hypothetical protein